MVFPVLQWSAQYYQHDTWFSKPNGLKGQVVKGMDLVTYQWKWKLTDIHTPEEQEAHIVRTTVK